MLIALTRAFRGLSRWSGGFALATGIAIGAHVAPAREPPAIVPLLSSGQTVVGEPVVYPSGARAKVTAAIVALAPGEETGWHTHATPVFGYMLDGEITVDYGAHGARLYRAGDSLLGAIAAPHNGRNTGSEPARILAVFMGAEGLMAATPVEAPK